MGNWNKEQQPVHGMVPCQVTGPPVVRGAQCSGSQLSVSAGHQDRIKVTEIYGLTTRYGKARVK